MENNVPKTLSNWFVLHFAADMLFAIPLMIAPRAVLEFAGWQSVDVFTARLVAAALFGIGIESYLGRNAGRETFIGMLNLKIIWSLGAVLGIAWSILESEGSVSGFAWIVLVTFLLFNFVWIYWRWVLAKLA